MGLDTWCFKIVNPGDKTYNEFTKGREDQYSWIKLEGKQLTRLPKRAQKYLTVNYVEYVNNEATLKNKGITDPEDWELGMISNGDLTYYRKAVGTRDQLIDIFANKSGPVDSDCRLTVCYGDPDTVYTTKKELGLIVAFTELGYQRKGQTNGFYDVVPPDDGVALNRKELMKHWKEGFDSSTEFKENIVDHFRNGSTIVVYSW